MAYQPAVRLALTATRSGVAAVNLTDKCCYNFPCTDKLSLATSDTVFLTAFTTNYQPVGFLHHLVNTSDNVATGNVWYKVVLISFWRVGYTAINYLAV